MASVIFAPHGHRCPDCAAYIGQLSTAVERLREWATRAMVLVAPEFEFVGSVAPADRAGVILLADEGGTGRARLGVREDQAAVVQADRWGAVYQVETIGAGGPAHAELPAPRDLVALAQFIDIQCPECGVPSKEWMSATPFPLG